MTIQNTRETVVGRRDMMPTTTFGVEEFRCGRLRLLQPRRRICNATLSFTRMARLVLATTALAIVTTATVGSAGAQPVAPLKNAIGSVFTADEVGNSISAINLSTGQLIITPTTISPHNVQVTVDGARLLAVGDKLAAQGEQGHNEQKHGGKAAGFLQIFLTSSIGSGPTTSIAVGDHPAHVVVDKKGRRAFVTLSGEDTVAAIDLNPNVILRKIPTGRYPHGLRISPNGRAIYVANVDDGSVTVIDTKSLSAVTRISVGKGPVQVGFTPDGSRVYVSLRDENKVAVIDSKTKAVLWRIDVGRNPIQVHATRDGRFVYVANQGTDAEPADTVSVIENATAKVVATIRTGAGAHGIAISNDGRFVFVTNIVAGTVSVIDAGSRSVVANFPVGKGPNGITYKP